MLASTPRKAGLTFALITSVFALGCTARVASIPIAQDPPKPGEAGTYYRLPQTAFRIDLTYELKRCGPTGTIRLIASEIKSEILPDPAAEFLIDNEKLSTWLKVVEAANFKFTNGFLTSVTYKAQDQTREAIASAGRIGVALAKLTATGGTSLPIQATLPSGLRTQFVIIPSEAQAKNVCTEAARTALQEHDELVQVESALRRAWQKRAVEMASRKTSKEEDASLDQLAARLKAVSARIGELRQEELIEKISLTAVPWLSATPTDLSKGLESCPAMRPASGTISRICANSESLILNLKPSPWRFRRWFESLNHLDFLPAYRIHLTPSVGGFFRPGDEMLASIDRCSTDGIFYRAPALADVRVYETNAGEEALAYERNMVPVLQLGRLLRIEIKNRVFQDNVHEVVFDDDGTMSKFEFADKSARAVELLGAVEDATASALSAQTAEVDRMKEVLEKQRDILRLQQEILELQKKSETTP